jgi:uncharacterized protein YndB with AHSA1/START domain
MTTIISEATIYRPIASVFDYVTTPAHWLDWHPSSLGLHGAIDHSLQVGEEVTEEFKVAGRTGSVTWRVVARDAPTLWAIAGKVAAGGNGTITYTLREAAQGTAFRREFVYTMPNPFAALLDQLFIRRRIASESALAVSRLKQALDVA